jgi:hypothetical protein
MLLNDVVFALTRGGGLPTRNRKRECEDHTNPRVNRLCLPTDRLRVQLE